MNVKQARAIYYHKQEIKYSNYQKTIEKYGFENDFIDFQKKFKCCYKNKVYYYFLKSKGVL